MITDIPQKDTVVSVSLAVELVEISNVLNTLTTGPCYVMICTHHERACRSYLSYHLHWTELRKDGRKRWDPSSKLNVFSSSSVNLTEQTN